MLQKLSQFPYWNNTNVIAWIFQQVEFLDDDNDNCTIMGGGGYRFMEGYNWKESKSLSGWY